MVSRNSLGRDQLFSILIEYSASEIKFQECVRLVLRYHLTKVPLYFIRDHKGNTPKHTAMRHGCWEVFQL